MASRTTTAAVVLTGEAVRSLLRHKSRSALAALGITIGIAAVAWVVAIGQAGSARAEEQLRELGDNLVWVEAGARNVNGVRTGSHGTTSLTVQDAEAIAREVPLIARVSPQVDAGVLVIHGERNWTTHYRGVSPEYLEIKRWAIAAGAAFSEDELGRAANVCLLGRTVRERLFGAEDPVGQAVRIGPQPFVVIGVLAPKGQSGTGQDQDDTLMLPYTTALKKFRGKGFTWLDDILCSAGSAQAVGPAASQITELLRQRHHIGLDDDDDFNIRKPEEVIKAQLETSKAFSLLLISTASVALLVGGVGVMNVMLASVMERTREIGLRLAIGATRGAIQMQFLAEAVVLSLYGGLQGIAVSLAGSFAIGRVVGWSVTIPAEAVLLAMAFSAAVGILFGLYPAWRAARLDPIVALRTE